MTGRPFPLLAGTLAALAAICAPVAAPTAASARTAEEPQIGGSTKALYLMLIHQARSDGRTRAALAYLDDFERQFPGELDARVLRINCLLDLGQTDQAAAFADQLPSGDRSGKVSLVRGHVQAARQQWVRAIADYRDALHANPADPLTINALGYAQLRAGQADAAVETLKGAADLAPGDAVVRNNLLLALTMAGRTAEAGTRLRAIRDPQAQDRLRRQIAEQSLRLSALQAPPAQETP